MASGLPVIASCIAGNEELVVDGETGYLVPSEPGSASGRLKKLLSERNPANKWEMPPVNVWKQITAGSTAQQYALLLEKVK